MKCFKSVTVSRCQILVWHLFSQQLRNLKTALNLVHVRGRKNFGVFMCCLAKMNPVFVCLSSWASVHATCLSLSCQCLSDWHILFLKVSLNLHGGGLRCSLHQEKQSFAADFDQVSSFGRRAKFPDNIACCGNRNPKVSGDTRVALSVHTWLHFCVWPSQTLWFSFFTQCPETSKHLSKEHWFDDAWTFF